MSEEAAFRARVAALGVPRAQESYLWDARAKLIWGDRPADVERDLLAAGIDTPTVHAFMRLCLGERAGAMCSKGMLDLFIGGALVLAGVLGGIGIKLAVDSLGPDARVPTKPVGIVWAICILAGIYGGYRLVRGLDRFVFGASADGAVVDVED